MTTEEVMEWREKAGFVSPLSPVEKGDPLLLSIRTDRMEYAMHPDDALHAIAFGIVIDGVRYHCHIVDCLPFMNAFLIQTIPPDGPVTEKSFRILDVGEAREIPNRKGVVRRDQYNVGVQMGIDTKKLSRSLMLGRGAILTPHIDAYLERGKFPDEWNITIHNNKQAREYGDAKIRFSAGSDALMSASELYKKVTGQLIQEKIGASLRRTFDCGTMWHEYLGAILVDMKFIEPEGVEKYHIQKIETDKGTAYGSGLGDLVGVNIPGHGSWLVDMKTMKKSDFESEPPKYLWDKYVAQINIYGDWFGYDKLMILGVEKDSPHRLREWIIEPDKDLVSLVYNKWVYVMSCVDLGVAPV